MAQDAFTEILNIKPDQVDAVTTVLSHIDQDRQNNSTGCAKDAGSLLRPVEHIGSVLSCRRQKPGNSVVA
jgi:hypothetical protein